MKLSAPIHILKNQAKSLKKNRAISMAEALNSIARREGFQSWSLLRSKAEDLLPSRYSDILDYLNPGDLALIGGRPGVGKTSFAVGLFVQAIQQVEAKHFLFTLDLIHRDVAGRIAAYDQTVGEDENRFYLDYSDAINADYIIEKTASETSSGSLILIDYLQLLDQRRSNPPVQEQVEKLKAHAKNKGCTVVFISQVSRGVESRTERRPTPADIRLPNPVNLGLFNKILLLYRESKRAKEVEVTFFRPIETSFKVSWSADSESPIFSDL